MTYREWTRSVAREVWRAKLEKAGYRTIMEPWEQTVCGPSLPEPAVKPPVILPPVPQRDTLRP